MATRPNPFYTTSVGQGLGSLAQAFAPDPGGEATALLRGAQSRLYGAQSDQIHTRMAASAAAADRLRGGDYSPENLAQVFAEGLRSADPQIMQAFPAFIRGFGGAANAGPERLAQLFVGAGGNYAHTQPGFEQNQATERRGQDVTAGTQRYGYDQQRAGAMEREQLQETGRNQRMAPEIGNNADVVVPPDSPLAGRAGPDGRITGPRVQTGAGARPTQRIDVNGPDATAIDKMVLSAFPAGTTVDETAAGAIRGRASDLYGDPNSPYFRDMPNAVNAAVEEAKRVLRYTAGWSLTSPSGTYSLPQGATIGTPMARPSPAGGPAAPPLPVAPTDQGAQQPAAGAVPPPAQREVGKAYQLPRGLFIWTGTGWRPAS